MNRPLAQDAQFVLTYQRRTGGSMGKTLVAILAVGILGVGLARALDFKNLESSGVEQVYSARTSVISTHAVVGYMTGWSVKAVGGTVDFTILHSTCGGNVSSHSMTNISSTIYVLSGETVSNQIYGMVKNPYIYLSRIDSPGTTVYVDISYLGARAPGGF